MSKHLLWSECQISYERSFKLQCVYVEKRLKGVFIWGNIQNTRCFIALLFFGIFLDCHKIAWFPEVNIENPVLEK